jgi:hypothetical protein
MPATEGSGPEDDPDDIPLFEGQPVFKGDFEENDTSSD